MQEDLKLVESIYDTCSMAIYSIEKLQEKIENKKNKILQTIKNIKKGYQRYQKDAKEVLKIANIHPKSINTFIKLSTTFNLSIEILHDNSDSAISEILIKGINMGIKEMDKELNNYYHFHKKTVTFTEQFINFQKDNINSLKVHL